VRRTTLAGLVTFAVAVGAFGFVTNIVVLDLLRALQHERKIAYLFIAHDLAVVRSISHRVGVLYRGELVEVGTVEEVYTPPFHPYTHVLLSAVPEIGVDRELSSAIRIDATPSGAKTQTACPFADRCPWKLGPLCEEVQPPWRSTSETHSLRCHIPLEELKGREASPHRVTALRAPEKDPAGENGVYRGARGDRGEISTL
jgi:peptide/nickel transport system ATP-binding protein